MTEFFNTIDTWERELLEKAESDEVEDVIEPQTVVEEDKEPSESFEAIDPSDDGLFQMLNASVRPVPMTSPKKRTMSHHPQHHHSSHHHHNHKASSPQRRSMKSRPSSSSESPDLPLNSEGVVSTPKTEARKSKPSSTRSTSRSHGNHATSEKDDLSASQKSSGSGSTSRDQRSTTTTTSNSSSRSKSQPRERGTTSRHHHHHTHRKERNKLTDGERHRSSSLGRKAHRQSNHGQNQQSRSHRSTSTGSSLSSTVHEDTSSNQEITATPGEPPRAADQSPTADDHSPDDNIEDDKEEPSPPISGKGVMAMLSQGIASAARTTRKETEKVVKGAAKAVTNPKELARSVGEAASVVTTGVMNATKTTNTESSPEGNQEEELGNQDKESNRLDSGGPNLDSKSDSSHHRSRCESFHSPKGTDKRYRERSRTGSGDLPSPQKSPRPDGLVTRSEHLDRNESGHGAKPTGRMTVRERRHQAAQLRNSNRPESQPPKTPTDTRSRTITSPNLPPRKSLDRKQSSQSQSSESKISDSSRKNQNDDMPNENDEDWLKARSTRQDDIMMFARKKDTNERKPLSWNGREQETMGQLAQSPRTSKREIKLESSHEKNQDYERKTILTAGAKVAKVAIGVTAMGAREAINAITNPKKEIEKVVRVSNKAAKKTARAASNPKETVQKMASITQKISLNVVREATEVTKGTLQLGRDTVQGTVGYVSGLLHEDDEMKDESRLKEKTEYDSHKLESRQVNASSLVDRVTRVVATSDEKANINSPLPPQSRDQRRLRGQNTARPGMPEKMPSRLVVDTTGKPNSSWET